MQKIPHLLLDQFNSAQSQIWQSVSMAVSEACNNNIQFDHPLTVSINTSELFNELSGLKLHLQFSFSSTPTQYQSLIIPQDTLLGLAKIIKLEEIDVATENLVAEIRPALDALIQGLCIAVGNLRNESVTSLNISTTLGSPTLPDSIQSEDEVIRITTVVACDSLNGTITWLINRYTAEFILGQVHPTDVVEFPIAEETPTRSTTPSSAAALPGNEESRSLDLLYDIPLEISVELGRVRMFIKDIIELGNGSIIEIDKAAGEPVDIMVNGRIVARGEVVVIEDNFGVRITEILNPKERLQRLGTGL